MKKWKELSRKTIDHNEHFKIEDILFELPNGKEEVFSIRNTGRVACLFAITKEKKVILCRQFRVGPNMVLDEIPGGRVDEGEDFKSAAMREFREETGYHVGKIDFLGEYRVSAYNNLVGQAFIGLNAEKSSEQDLDSNEFIEVIEKSLDNFEKQLRQGLLTDPQVGWMALDYLQT